MDIVEEIPVSCPHCGETFFIEVETTTTHWSAIEDCAVCCRPMTIHIACEPGSVVSVSVEPA